MSIYNAQQLISASNATYFTNTSGSITAADVRGLNTNWISSSALLSGSNSFVGNQTISGSLTAQLPANYIWLGNSSGYSQAVATSSISLQGAQGIQGLQGSQGISGSNGAQGVSGSQGITGAQGITGSQGIQGIQGTQGTQGVSGQFVQGSQGASGGQGSAGQQGTQGAQGISGSNGTQGADGTQGATGQLGTQGIQGGQGFTGGAGQNGTQGAQGATGTGTQGATGTQGSTGTSNAFFNYKSTTGATSGAPATGHILWNNATQTSATSISVNDTDLNSNNIDVFLSNLSVGSTIVLQDQSVQANYQSWLITSRTDNSTYWTYGVSYVGGGYTFTNNQDMLFILAAGAQGAQGTQGTTGQSIQGAQGFQGVQGVTGATAQLVINNNNNNNVLTATGTSTLQGENNLTFDGSTLGITGNINASSTLTASLQEGYTWVGNGSNISTLVATSSFGSGGSINTGSFATTGSNTFRGDQIITGSITLAGSQFVSVGGVNGNQVSFNSSSLSLQNPALTTITYASPTAYLQMKGNFYLENQVGNVGSGSINISALGGGNLNLTGSQLRLSGVDFIPFSASLNSRILAITGSGGTINTGSFITTGSASNVRQAISGGFAFNTVFITSASVTSQASGVNVLPVSYGDVYGPYATEFDFWLRTGFAGVIVSGSGITNGAVTGYNYGDNLDVYIVSGSITNATSYRLTGPLEQTISITGSLVANSTIGIVSTDGTNVSMNQYGIQVSAPTRGLYGVYPGMFQFQDDNNIFSFAVNTASMFNGGGTWTQGPQIAQYDGMGDASMVGFQSSAGYTDGRVTFLTPIVGYQNLELTGSLTASLANGYTWVGDSNNKTKLVATSSFSGPQGAQGVAGQFVQGSQGASGAQGATTQGVQGTTGTQGADGQAIQGATGQSITGPQGIQGIQGASGTGGQQGAQGATGGQGTQGATGTNGYGYQGLNTTASLTLQTGTVTFTTNTNVTSNAFQTGNRIRLAYQSNPSLYWEEGVITAYTTNQMTVLIDLVNVSGGTYSGFDIGITGQQGNIGLQGIQGTAGQAGATGGQGIQGNTGAGGQQGTQGATGTGTQGAQGTSGTNGTNGTNGSQGAAGGTGAQGSAGGSGPQGSTGGTGAQGSAGSNGSNGSQGATGATGAQGATGATGSGFSSISPAYNNALVISNASSNSAFTNSSIYVSGNTIYADAFYQNSSRELKTNIIAFDEDAIALLKRVSVVTFYYKNDTFTPHIGFIAEDTPQELSGINQNMMDVPSVVGTLIKAVQQLQAQNDSLVARIEALENR